MPTADFSSYHQPSGTVADGTKFDNLIDAVQAAVNGIDNNNFATGKIFDPAKLMQNAAVDGDAMVWDNTNSKWVPASAMPATSVKPGLYKLWDSTEAGASFPAVSLTTSALPQTFKHLLVEFVMRGDGAGVDTDLNMRINGDATAIYDYTLGGAKAAATIAASTAAATSANVCSGPGTNGSAGEVGTGHIKIQNYASTAHHKLFNGVFSKFVGTTTTDFAAVAAAGRWRSSAAISTLTFIPVGGSNIVTPSRITVYGEA